jgi:hypothetical protein
MHTAYNVDDGIDVGASVITPPSGYEENDYFVVSPVLTSASATYNPAREGSMVSRPSYPALSPMVEPAAWDPLAYQTQSPMSATGTGVEGRSRSQSGDKNADGTNLSRGLSGKWGSIRRNTLGGGNRGYGPLMEDLDEDTEAIPIDISEFPDLGAAPTMPAMASPAVGLGDPNSFEMKPFRRVPTFNASNMVPGVGGGMNNVKSGHIRGRSLADAHVLDAVQKKVQTQDHIVAFVEPGVDLTGFDGGDFTRRNMTTTSFQSFDHSKKEGDFHGGEQPVSYMFPDDPTMASWRPVSMKWPYITLLILIALMLGGLQEFLCQLSIQRKANHGGLLVFDNPKDIATQDYFAWKYMPTLVLVTYGVMWQAVDYDVKRLEAFYQLSKPDGALAKDSLNIDYLTSMSYLVPVMAIGSRQWAVVLSSITTLVAGSLLPVLQAASVDLSPNNDNNLKLVNINPLWSRIMTGLLGLIALLGVSLLFSLRRKSGLLSDPKGIAGIASMATKSHILADFEGMDTKSNEVIHTALRKRRYRLYKSSLWQGRFVTTAEKKTSETKDSKLSKLTAGLTKNPLPVILQRKAAIPFIIYIATLAALIPLFLFLHSANSFITHAPWVLTLLATVIKVLWSTLDISVRVVEPLYILSQRRAPAKTLTLDYTALIPGLTIFTALKNRHHLVALVSTGAILTEILTVCVTSLGVNGSKFISGEGGDGSQVGDRTNSTDTFRSFWISFGGAMFVIFYLLIVSILVAVRRHTKFLPRQPGSISSVLALIYSSNMLMDFVDTEYKNSKEMTNYLSGLGKSYGLGWFNAKRDNKDHCGVDEEPLLDYYRHGKDWKETRLVENVSGWETL